MATQKQLSITPNQPYTIIIENPDRSILSRYVRIHASSRVWPDDNVFECRITSKGRQKRKYQTLNLDENVAVAEGWQGLKYSQTGHKAFGALTFFEILGTLNNIVYSPVERP